MDIYTGYYPIIDLEEIRVMVKIVRKLKCPTSA